MENLLKRITSETEKDRLQKLLVNLIACLLLSGILATSDWDLLVFYWICGLSALGAIVVSILYYFRVLR